MVLEFSGARGTTPSAEARRYVQRVLVTMLAYELEDMDGWMFGGIEEEPDRRRLKKAIKAEMARLSKLGRSGGDMFDGMVPAVDMSPDGIKKAFAERK